jgi:hypothetical protein
MHVFLVTDLPPPPAIEMVQPAPAASSGLLVVASTSAHLKTIKQCPAHEHWKKGVCVPYIEWMMPPPAKTAKG